MTPVAGHRGLKGQHPYLGEEPGWGLGAVRWGRVRTPSDRPTLNAPRPRLHSVLFKLPLPPLASISSSAKWVTLASDTASRDGHSPRGCACSKGAHF